MTYYFKDAIEVYGTYTLTYHILDNVSYFFVNAFVPYTAPDTSSNTGSTHGALAGIVLFMVECIGYS